MPIQLSGGVIMTGRVNLIPSGSGATPGASGPNNYGYTSGGFAPGVLNTIDKFPFASDANATDVGDLTEARYMQAGASSSISGYTSGGWGTVRSKAIDKFSFASDGDATAVGDLLQTVSAINGGSQSADNGYVAGGYSPAAGGDYNVIQKFPFASDDNSSDVGDLTVARAQVAGQSSSISGYTSGGKQSNTGAVWSNVIDKFPFASDSNASDVGDMTLGRDKVTGQSSAVSGYISGGFSPAGGIYEYNIIEKFPFSSDANASDVGDLTGDRFGAVGQFSTANGYSSGGFTPSAVNTIDKFPFASDANASDVGDLTVARNEGAGQQY